MQNKCEREVELRDLLQTPQGMEAIMQLYRDKVAPTTGTGALGRIGLLACQMIPRILDAEFSKAVPG